jgi:hypothetical protein
MKLELNQPCVKPFDPAVDLRVLTACENATAAGQACALLEDLGRDCAAQGRLLLQWWNFEVLAITALRELASQEAAAADVVIITGLTARRLPPNVAGWIRRWIELRKGRPGALVALLNSNLKTPFAAGGIHSQLKALAAFGHLDFFANISHGEKHARLDETTKRLITTWITRRANEMAGSTAQPAPPIKLLYEVNAGPTKRVCKQARA